MHPAPGRNVCLRSGADPGHDPVRHFPPAPCAEADEAGDEPEGRQDGLLFPGGRTYQDDHQSGYGAYTGVRNVKGNKDQACRACRRFRTVSRPSDRRVV